MSGEEKQEQVPHKFCDGLDAFIRHIGHFFMWANVILIFVIILQVFLRYGLGRGLVILEEIQWHLYALGIMFGASYAMMMDSHIRVDIIHARLSAKWRLRWDLFGILFLLIPFIIIILVLLFRPQGLTDFANGSGVTRTPVAEPGEGA